MSGVRGWVPVVPVALVVTGVLALAVTWLQGPALKAGLSNRAETVSIPAPQPDQRAVQSAIDRVLADTPITFEPDSADLTETGQRVIGDVAGILRTAPAGMTFEVAGHVARGPGSEAAALELSQARADAVAKTITAAGVPAERITAKGYGDTRPNANGDDRRVEIMVR